MLNLDFPAEVLPSQMLLTWLITKSHSQISFEHLGAKKVKLISTETPQNKNKRNRQKKNRQKKKCRTHDHPPKKDLFQAIPDHPLLLDSLSARKVQLPWCQLCSATASC